MRRLLLFLLVILGATVAHGKTVTVLLDASYSMALASDDRRRLDSLVDSLERDLAERASDTAYALLAVSHGAELDLLLPFPASARRVVDAARQVEPFGSIDLVRAITAAAHLAASIAATAGDEVTELLVVTDAEDLQALTGGTPPSLPAGVTLSVITPKAAGPASIEPWLAAVSSLGSRGLLPRSAIPPTVPAAEPRPIDPLAPPPAPDSDQNESYRGGSSYGDTTPSIAPPSQASPGPTAAPARRHDETLLHRWARTARWLFAIAALLGVFAWLRALARHRARAEAVRVHNARPPTLVLEIRSAGGRDEITVDGYPATFGTFAGLPDHHRAHANGSLTVTTADDGLVLTSSDGVRINGTTRAHHVVADRDQIRLGKVRMIVREIRPVQQLRPPRAPHRRYPLPIAAALALALTGLLLTRQPGGSAPSVPIQSIAPPAQSRRTAETTIPWIARRSMPRLSLPLVVAPDGALPDVELDYLVIHAHPDDEAIDFGALMAAMHAARLRGGVVLLTDGEGGRDQYPARAVDETYPPHDLTGAALARVRVQEAREAIGWLGGELYVRLGLPNRPYYSVTEEREASVVLDDWGGLDELTRRLTLIAEHLRPRFILSPDLPSSAREHFEHEATGIAVAELVQRLLNDPRSRLEAHIVAVDPMQRTAYDDLIELSPWEGAADREAPRLRQMLALRAHRTQRDAVVIGVETRLAIAHDVYRIPYGAPGFRLQTLLDAVTVDRSVGSP